MPQCLDVRFVAVAFMRAQAVVVLEATMFHVSPWCEKGIAELCVLHAKRIDSSRAEFHYGKVQTDGEEAPDIAQRLCLKEMLKPSAS